eukprot:COSAG06_NODE_6370_length_2963_cov_2.951117_2_plen_287_part_00
MCPGTARYLSIDRHLVLPCVLRVLQPSWRNIYNAAMCGDVKTAQAALDKGAPIECTCPYDSNMTPILTASWCPGNVAMVAFLGSRGANVNARNPQTGDTALHLSVPTDVTDTANDLNAEKKCNTLLALGADPTIRNSSGQTALGVARKNRKGGEERQEEEEHEEDEQEEEEVPRCEAVLVAAMSVPYESASELKWEELSQEEQEAATLLGWDTRSWDDKEAIDMKTEWDELSEAQSRAATLLGFTEKEGESPVILRRVISDSSEDSSEGSSEGSSEEEDDEQQSAS